MGKFPNALFVHKTLYGILACKLDYLGFVFENKSVHIVVLYEKHTTLFIARVLKPFTVRDPFEPFDSHQYRFFFFLQINY